MSKHPSLLQQFRSFCFQNNVSDVQKAVEYFAVFGGMGWNIDMSKSLDTLIEKKVLTNYKYIHADITTITQSNNTRHAVLTALATGDRREHSAFKKAKVSRKDGEHLIDFLIENDLVTLENSLEKPVKEEEISDKLNFIHPFMRFWFSSISPYYKGIKDGKYKEMFDRWAHTKVGFSDYIMGELFKEVVKKSFTDDPIVSIGSYWDQRVEVDILAKTASGKLIAGSCKYSKAKAGKNVLLKLKDDCKKAKLPVDTFVMFSKNKFSNELKKERGADLVLFSSKHISSLLNDLSEKDLLVNTNKKY